MVKSSPRFFVFSLAWFSWSITTLATSFKTQAFLYSPKNSEKERIYSHCFPFLEFQEFNNKHFNLTWRWSIFCKIYPESFLGGNNHYNTIRNLGHLPEIWKISCTAFCEYYHTKLIYHPRLGEIHAVLLDVDGTLYRQSELK